MAPVRVGTDITIKLSVDQVIKGIVEELAAGAPAEVCPADPVAAARWEMQHLHQNTTEYIKDQLTEKLIPLLMKEIVSQYEKAESDTVDAIKARVDLAKTTVATAAKRMKEAEAVALEGTGKGPLSLKIVGVGGIDQVEAKAKYLTAREKLLLNHVAVGRIEQIQTENLEAIQRNESVPSDRSKQLAMHKAQLQTQMYKISSNGRGNQVRDSNSDVDTIPIPKELCPAVQSERKKVLTEFHQWTQKDSVIKRFPLARTPEELTEQVAKWRQISEKSSPH